MNNCGPTWTHALPIILPRSSVKERCSSTRLQVLAEYENGEAWFTCPIRTVTKPIAVAFFKETVMTATDGLTSSLRSVQDRFVHLNVGNRS